jgi:NAD(P)H-dependent flavin oxidoreductase YrpB (nitropropane dioxygenase family)
MHAQYFNSRYPILEAAMYKGSDVPLALACHQAGIFPSLVIPYMHISANTVLENHSQQQYIDDTDNSLVEFKKGTGLNVCDIVLSIDSSQFFNPLILKIVKSHRVSHLEVFPNFSDTSDLWGALQNKFGKNFQSMMNLAVKSLGNIKIMERRSSAAKSANNTALNIKGSDSGGFNTSEYTTSELFDIQKALTPDAVIIPHGGIGTPSQVADYLTRGATAVAVGTVLAASLESSLSMEAKQKMVSSKKEDLARFPDTNQQALVLGNKEFVLSDQSKVTKEDWNRDYSLESGIKSTGDQGHIYAGAAVDTITEIKSVKEIVRYLVSEIPSLY